MEVKFRIVGLFFGASPGVGSNPTPKFSGTEGEVSVTLDDNPPSPYTVADVMHAVKKKVAAGGVPNVVAFDYLPSSPGPDDFLKQITVCYSKLPPRTFSSKTKGPYAFTLKDNANPLNSQELQYYIFREDPGNDYVQLNKNNVTRTFGVAPDTGAEIVDGVSVVWRQVSIIFQENGTPVDMMIAKKKGGAAGSNPA